ADAEHLRGLASVATRLAQSRLNDGLFNLLHRGARLDGDDISRRLLHRLDAGHAGVSVAADSLRGADGDRLRITNPPAAASRLGIQPAAQLLDLQLELEQAVDDELQLAPARAFVRAHHRPDVHGQEARVTALAKLPRQIVW